MNLLDDFKPEDYLIPKQCNSATLYSICNDKKCYIKVTADELFNAYEEILDRLEDEKGHILLSNTRLHRSSDPSTKAEVNRAVDTVDRKMLLVNKAWDALRDDDHTEYFIEVNDANYIKGCPKLEDTYIYDIVRPRILVGVYEQSDAVVMDANLLTHVLDDSFNFRAYMIPLAEGSIEFLKMYSHSGNKTLMVPLSNRKLRSAQAEVARCNKKFAVRKCMSCGKPFCISLPVVSTRAICFNCEEAKIAAAYTSIFNS